MFTQPVASPTSPGLRSISASPPPASPTRLSRLRGLSYLRNYTQTHLLSREHSAHHNAQNNDNHNVPAAQASAALLPPQASSPLSLSAPLPPQVNEQSASAANIINNGNNTNHSSNNTPIHANSSNPSSTRSTRFSHLLPTLTSTHPLNAPVTEVTSASAVANLSVPTDASVDRGLVPPNNNMTNTLTRARSATVGDAVPRPEGVAQMDVLPSIRFSAFHDPRANRPSLKFPPIARTLPTGSEVIRVGRYSERDNIPNIPTNVPSAAPVGFKSKVVSRRHCEFWYEEGKWYIKDVKSSSGTFLNHIRLSPPGQESKPFAVNDGDIVQLGIDFKGGEEMIFRCVKMRLELNRGWQNKLNAFNLQSHKRLRNMTTGSANDSAAQSYSQDCSICLNTIAPCQCLFVAPCSHTWHYKCIRSLLSSPSYPIFICPNCRAAADLEAEVEELEEWEQLDSDEGALLKAPGLSDPQDGTLAAPRKSRESVRSARHAIAAQQPSQPVPVPQNAGSDVVMIDAPAPASNQADATLIDTRDAVIRPALLHSNSNPTVPIRIRPTDGQRETRTPSPTGGQVTNGHEGPITPRNDAGPWVFDGSGVRLRPDGSISETRVSSLGSLEAAVQAAGNGRRSESPQDIGSS